MQALIIDTLFEIKAKQNQKIFFVVVNVIIGVALKLVLTHDLALIKSIIAIITLFVSLKYIFQLTFKRSFFSLVILIAITMPIETLAGLMNSKVLHLSAETNDTIKSIPMLFIYNFMFSLVAHLIYYFKNNKFSFVFKDINSTNLYLGLIITISFILPNVIFYANNNYNYPIYLLIYNIIANLALVLIGIYNTYNCVQLKIKKRDLENAQLYNNQLITLIDSIRVFKHDYNNVVQSIGGYVALKDLDGLCNYYKGLLQDCQRVNHMESISPLIINEPSVYGIMASKCQIAELKGIEFNIDSVFDYKKLCMDVYPFCKVLGILLDNAIEAAEETRDKVVNVIVKENPRKNIQSITIENTYNNKSIDLNKIYEKGFSTKKRNSGIGLWEVKNIINKTTNAKINTTKDKKYFRQQLVINLSPITKIQSVVEI
jgi:two-component system sensor histidine kinase AgrC